MPQQFNIMFNFVDRNRCVVLKQLVYFSTYSRTSCLRLSYTERKRTRKRFFIFVAPQCEHKLAPLRTHLKAMSLSRLLLLNVNRPQRSLFCAVVALLRPKSQRHISVMSTVFTIFWAVPSFSRPFFEKIALQRRFCCSVVAYRPVQSLSILLHCATFVFEAEIERSKRITSKGLLPSNMATRCMDCNANACHFITSVWSIYTQRQSHDLCLKVYHSLQDH